MEATQDERVMEENSDKMWSTGKGNGKPLQYSCLENPMISSVQFSSVQFSCSVMSDSLGPHGPQHARPPCPSPTPRVYPLMSIEVVMPSNHLILCCPLLLLPSVFPSIRVFSNTLFESGGQSTGVSASTSVLPMNT